MLVHESVHTDFVAALAEHARATRTGRPDEDDVAYGPVNNANQLRRITGYLERLPDHADVVAGRRGDALLLLEQPPVFTAGKRTQPEDMPDNGLPVIDVDRGGRITWHGEGQLVVYPILKLAEPVDVVDYVRRLEQGGRDGGVAGRGHTPVACHLAATAR